MALTPGSSPPRDDDERGHCADGGWLVGTAWPVAGPEDPALTVEEVDANEVRGCGHLHCSSCDRPVRRWDGRRFRETQTLVWVEPPEGDEAARELEMVREAYDADDPSSHLEDAPEYRAYSCRCMRINMRSLEDLQGSSIPHAWACGGHSPRSGDEE